MIVKRHAYALMAAMLLLMPVATATGNGGVRTVALSGQPAPGAEAGVVFNMFNYSGRRVELNDRGQVAFYAVMVGPGITLTNNRGAWTEGRGAGLELVARGGDPAPGRPGANFTGSALFNLQINAQGVTAIGEHNPGFWSDFGNSGLQLIAERRPAPVPGIENAVFDNFPERAVLNDRGRITIPAVIHDAPALVVHDPTDGYSILFEPAGSQAPGLPEGILLDPSPVTNLIEGHETNSGRYFLVSRLVGPDVDAANDRAFWIEDDAGELQIAIREGDQAPELTAGILISSFGQMVNDVGQFAFTGRLTGTGINSTNNAGIWVGGPGSQPRLVMRTGESAPGTSGGAMFGPNFFPQPVSFNDLGQVAFNAPLTGAAVTAANDSGMWSSGGGAGLRLVAREGDPAPGAPIGAIFGELYPPDIGDYSRLNNVGQMAFVGRLTGSGVTADNDTGIWGQDRNGALHLIVREGDVLDVDDGPGSDLRTIEHLGTFSLPGITDDIQRCLQFNDVGQIEFEAIFSDGSQGIFVSNAIAQLAADFNGDAVVDAADLATWRTGFGAAQSAAHVQGDADGDADVDGGDFLVWQRQIGGGPIAAVPEPNALTIAVIGLAAFARRRR